MVDLSDLDIELASNLFRGAPREDGYTLKGICFPIFALAIDSWLTAIHEKGGCDRMKIYFLSGAHKKLTDGGETYSTRAAARLLMQWAEFRVSSDFNGLDSIRSFSSVVPPLPRETLLLSPRRPSRRLTRSTNDAYTTAMSLSVPASSSNDLNTWRVHANVTMALVHSGGGVFGYDENVKFINEELMPKIDSDRQSCQQTYGEDWETYFSITLTLAEGAPARISAICQGLQFMRPNYIHIFRPKSFNDEPLLREDGVKFLTFAQASTTAPIPIRSNCFTGETTLDIGIRLVVDEMIRHKQLFVQSLQEENEVDRFWLRKTHKTGAGRSHGPEAGIHQTDLLSWS